MKSKILNILLSVVIALGIWIYVITVVSPNSDRVYTNIAVKIDDAVLHERGLMVTNKEGHTVSLHVVGSRVELNKLSSENFKVTVDLSKIYTAGTHNLVCDVAFKDISQSSLDIMEQMPGTISLNVEEYVSKNVPININYTGNLDSQYMVDKENAVLDYKEIQITGPGSVVGQIENGAIQIDLGGRTESIVGKFPVLLFDKDGNQIENELLKLEVTEVDLSVKIYRVKDIPIEIDIIEGGGAINGNYVITKDAETISVYGSDNLLDGFDVLKVGTIDLSTITDGYTETFPIKLPEGINNESGLTEVTVTVTFPELETVQMTVTNIVAINVPGDKTVVIKRVQMDLTIRGPKEKIALLKPEDIIVRVDCTGIETGTAKLKPDVDCGDPEIGAVSVDSIAVEVKDKAPNAE